MAVKSNFLSVEAMHRQQSIEITTVKSLESYYQAIRLAHKKVPFDGSQSCTTVKQYLTLLDDDPPTGALTLDDIRHILVKGLARHHPDGESKTTFTTIENVMNSIGLIAGEGPFRGNRTELIKSVARFSETYFDVCQNKEPIDAALTTFLALSFYDISTPRDHERLCTQISKLSKRLQSQINNMLCAHTIDSLVTPEDVNGIFHRCYKQEFRRYVDDPLCPAFKFPLTANEEVRLINKLIIRFDRLEPLFEEMALNVKYGGVSARLKEATLKGISQAVRNLLASTAFLRRPSYAGVICQYRSGHGFSTVIPATLYQADQRPKERFQAMQHFHIGHRLEDIVKREQTLVELDMKRNQKK